MDIAGKKITIVGLGESGTSAAVFLKDKGAEVYITDSASSAEIKNRAKILLQKGIKVQTEKHTKDFITGSEFVVLSPGIKDDSLPVKWAKELNIKTISEIELGFCFCKGKIIAVTGTNGKTTTVTLIADILKNAGKDVVLCGNIGQAFSSQLDKISKDTFVVLEVSSFQLKYIKTFKPYISVILNFSQNHLDMHESMEEYFSSKKNIYKNQDENDYTIINFDDAALKKLKSEINSKCLFFSLQTPVTGAYSNKKSLFLNIDQLRVISDINLLTLKQPHNIENFLAVSLCAFLCEAPIYVIKDRIASFKGLEHRCKLTTTIKGVNFINDSKSTTVESTKAALKSINGEVILIAGGRDKGSDFELISKEVKMKVKSLILIGEAKDKIAKALSKDVDIIKATDMDNAISNASKIAKQGENVLFSPMCASFDMYKNYKERGNAFKAAVEKLKIK